MCEAFEPCGSWHFTHAPLRTGVWTTFLSRPSAGFWWHLRQSPLPGSFSTSFWIMPCRRWQSSQAFFRTAEWTTLSDANRCACFVWQSTHCFDLNCRAGAAAAGAASATAAATTAILIPHRTVPFDTLGPPGRRPLVPDPLEVDRHLVRLAELRGDALHRAVQVLCHELLADGGAGVEVRLLLRRRDLHDAHDVRLAAGREGTDVVAPRAGERLDEVRREGVRAEGLTVEREGTLVGLHLTLGVRPQEPEVGAGRELLQRRVRRRRLLERERLELVERGEGELGPVLVVVGLARLLRDLHVADDRRLHVRAEEERVLVLPDRRPVLRALGDPRLRRGVQEQPARQDLVEDGELRLVQLLLLQGLLDAVEEVALQLLRDVGDGDGLAARDRHHRPPVLREGGELRLARLEVERLPELPVRPRVLLLELDPVLLEKK